MGILLRDLFSEHEETVLTFGTGTIRLKYRKLSVSPAMMEQMQALLRGSQSEQHMLEAASALCTFLAQTLIEWDLLLEPGVMYPLEKDDLMKLPIVFLTAVAEATQGESVGEATPGETTSNGSDAILPRQAKSAKFRSGIRTLEPANGSTARPGNSFRKATRSARTAGLKRSS